MSPWFFPIRSLAAVILCATPAWWLLLAFLDAQPNERFTVIFDDLKRFARDTRFHLDLRDAFRLRGASIECLNFKFDDTPEGEFIETIMAAQGALERKQNGRQVAQKMKARMQSGYWIHNPPVGYRYETVKGHGKLLIPNPPFDAIIREAIERYASGHFQTQAEVKRYFEKFPDFPRNKHGEIRQQRVTDILSQPLYTGYICSEVYGINWLKGYHEPLISVETYEKVQARRNGVAKAPMRKNIGNDFALRGFVCCADCNTPLRSSWTKGKTKRYPYYLCQSKAYASYGKSIARNQVESDVGDLIKQLQPSQKLFILATAMLKYAWDHQRNQSAEIVSAAKRKVMNIEKEIDALLTRILAASNNTVIARYEDKIAELENRRLDFPKKQRCKLLTAQPSKKN
ncbi:recombinase family protein [Parasedimentitalea marina]|nr:recombinase family protein [Parasedimentitalea marina]